MKFLTIGDIHIKDDNYTMRQSFYDKLVGFLHESNNLFDHVVILGDVLDKHEKLNTTYMNEAIDLFKRIVGIIHGDLIVLVGNHDMINNQQICNPKGHWMYGIVIPRVVIVDKPVVIYNCVFCPYLPPSTFYDTLCSYIAEDVLKQVDGFFAHQEFIGSSMNTFLSEHGDAFDFLTDTQWVVSGHIHDRQWLKNTVDQPKIFYVGSVMQHSLGDNDRKIIALCTFPSNPPSLTEIDLHVPTRIHKKIKPSELESWMSVAELHRYNKYTLSVECSPDEFKQIKSRFKKLPDNLQIKHIPILVQVQQLPDRTKTFIEACKDVLTEHDWKYMHEIINKS